MTQTNSEVKELLRKLDNKIDQLDRKVDKRIDGVEAEIKLVKNDLGWLKWIMGFAFSAILLLLSIILTVLFKLVN